ncbi:copper chaperone [Paenibacillus glucanolyticus]|uniref:cation transporter n=1 Tax=Paenibacillus TaxID=44249 RepID=UPI0003E251E4|nr:MULTISPECIES: cation transporter [Paenibacillus]ANA79982.1 copper resistance protein CopZ [Paenibacillus glucanolyticus]AVV55992.1 copper chaperone [Paenibacillus glucanolyticus]AWP30527.1 copper resistance protein CopZ [Paenibacillus sp. Cedars]ETT38369.1 copper ion-binding protein [Paenibacillus sp. FSL R5-808]MDH6675289.1 copper chaperone [Paenibacillus sp. LBL]
MEQVTMKVEGMSCMHCVNSIEGALKQQNIEGHVDLKAGTVSVKYDEAKFNLEEVKEIIEEQGYNVV